MNPSQPYFPDQLMRIGPGRWEVGRFQPVFLFGFTKGDTPFFKVAYRDASAKIRLMDIYVGRAGAASLAVTAYTAGSGGAVLYLINKRLKTVRRCVDRS